MHGRTNKMKVIQGENVPIKMWVRDEDVESGTIDQARILTQLPFLFKHIALMPDCHHGYGMPIGGVMATKGYVLPNAVGVDIGCGMIAQKTNIKVEDFTTEQLKQIMSLIRKAVPVGFNKHKIPCKNKEMPKEFFHNTIGKIAFIEYSNACLSLGTLGGGNHFIEIQKGDDGFIWIMIHSGSRNLGKKVCDHYNKLAKDLNEKWHSKAPKDLNFLPINSIEGKNYLAEMDYCLEFAQKNRQKMMEACIGAFTEVFEHVKLSHTINIHHNYAVMENHYGQNVMVHRKGATKATEGLKGIIPGSQGTCSYIVEGLGNRESFMSCSHGAGRKMGRNDAKRNLDFEAEKKALDDKGILHTVWTKGDLDEAPGSYKDIDVVMDNQKDLVKILVKLEPLGVMKG